jgi:hypothetical protein
MPARTPEDLANGTIKPVPLPDAINAIDPVTGMSPLHVAAGTNQLDVVRLLVEAGATFFPDNHGRWPSTIALICEADEALIDFIVQAEERAVREGRAFDPPETLEIFGVPDETRKRIADEAARRMDTDRRNHGVPPKKN